MRCKAIQRVSMSEMIELEELQCDQASRFRLSGCAGPDSRALGLSGGMEWAQLTSTPPESRPLLSRAGS